MEYFELIKTIEFDMENDSHTVMVRIELLRSNTDCNKYRGKVSELTDYNMYPSFLNSGPKGEDLRNFHSSDRIWRGMPLITEEIYTGFNAASERDALDKVINEMGNLY